MRKLLFLFAVAAILAGCSSKTNSSKPLPTGTTLEVYTVVTTQGPNTIPATDPATGAALILQTPPILTSFDIATVARRIAESKTADGGTRSETGLKVTLTPTGATKMATATATPAGMQMAMVVNGNVVAAPKVHSPIHRSFQVSGGDQGFNIAVDTLTNQ